MIDDFLPVYPDGGLIFNKSDETNEFWSALLEKAYVKLHGSYGNLDLGCPRDGMVDLSGNSGCCLMGSPTMFSVKAVLASPILQGSASQTGGRDLFEGCQSLFKGSPKSFNTAFLLDSVKFVAFYSCGKIKIF